MTSTVVINKKDAHRYNPEDCVSIMRGSKWGNPYAITSTRSRSEALRLHKLWVHSSGLVNDIEELRGRVLVCCCKPLPCHGDYYVELLEGKV